MDLEQRIERADRRVDNARECAATRRDEALGAAEAGCADCAVEALAMAERHTNSAETWLHTAQALRNEQRLRGYRVRRARLAA